MAAAAFGCGACFEEHPCSDEVCDGRDNDCDGRSDEGFVDLFGDYTSAAHCGGCGVACDAVFPSAQATRCDTRGPRPHCAIASCPAGEQLAGSGACVPVRPVLCLPCTLDAECQVLTAEARCLPDAMGGGHCTQPCAAASECPRGFRCSQVSGGARAQCVPSDGSCACGLATLGAEFACERQDPTGAACVGAQRCLASGLSQCEPVLAESCNEADDDCDGEVDESFRDALGRYVGAEHCGGCGLVCAPLGAHQSAECLGEESEPARCERSCEEGFVDVDGLAATGCECQLRSDSRPRVDADNDCDGEIDPTPELVFVSVAGSDDNAGTDASAPVRSLERGLELASSLGRDVLVARGVYPGPLSVRAGVDLTGGYSPDFREHDFELYPVMVEAPAAEPGAPALLCEGVLAEARIEGLTLVASPGQMDGQGSTAVRLDGCGPAVVLARIVVAAARGAAGRAGEDSSDRTLQRDGAGLRVLNGVSGGAGEPGADGERGCAVVAAGGGGDKTCGSGSVRGGRGGDARCAALTCDNASSAGCGNAGCTDFTVDGVCDSEAALAAAVANPAPEAGAGSQPGAAGALSYDAPTNHGVCEFCDDNPSLSRSGAEGGTGRAGVDGSAGPGCTGTIAFDGSGRSTAPAGGGGGDGSDGSGGGGGSAGAGFARILNTSGTCESLPGGAGGGGGSGGCAAPGAAGGGGGGGSIGVLIRLAAGATSGPSLSELRVVAASGGDGGDGGIGASGGRAGSGGAGGRTDFWCAHSGGRGGDGGPGGGGGGGGGGCGGPSLGVYVAVGGAIDGSAYIEALRAGVTVERAGTGGRGGQGGFSPGQSGGGGLSGEALDVVTGL